MTPTIEKHRVIEPNAPRFVDWMRNRGGIAVWGCLDLSDPSKTWSTPANQIDGKPTTKPHWSATNNPIRIITDWDEIVVDTPKEVKRFHVAIRRGSQGLSFKLTDGSSAKLRNACEKAGDGSWYEFDYQSQEAVILVPGASMTLKEWANKYGA